MRQRDPFQVLGVTPEAERAVIRAAYRALAKMYHPDTQQGIPADVATERMAELNWAQEELEKDLDGWRVRVLGGVSSGQETAAAEQAAPADRPPPREESEFDEEAFWQEFTRPYRRPKDEPLGWREWIGSDVVCNHCGCVLNTYVYKCPDCGQTGAATWTRSKLHSVGHRFRFVYWAVVFAVAYGIAVPFALAVLSIPPIILLDTFGVDDTGWAWEWGTLKQVLVGIGVAIEMVIIAAWMTRDTLMRMVANLSQ